MQIVINLPEQDYFYIAKKHCLPSCDDKTLRKYFYEMIAKGTPLPKGHGKLVDVNSIPEEDRDIIVKSLLRPGTIAFAGAIDLEEYVNGLPTIIEADKGSEVQHDQKRSDDSYISERE